MSRLHAYAARTALLLTLAGGCAPRNQYVQPPPPRVTVAQPVVRDVTTYHETTGILRASDEVEIRARVRGFLKETTFAPGDTVEAGTVLFVIERGPYEAALNAANGELAQTKAALSLARTTFDRKQELYAQNAISELELRAARADNDAAQAAVDMATARVQGAEIDLAYTAVEAPISGRLSRDFVSVGNLVGAGEATLLTTLVNDQPMHAFFQVGERDLLNFLGVAISKMQAGDKTNLLNKAEGAAPIEVRLELADGTVYPLMGRVDFIDNQLDPDTGTVEVRAVYPNPAGALVPGLFAKVGFPVEHANAVLVPERAVLQDLAGRYVLVVNDEDVVETRPIEPGPPFEQLRVIKSGLTGAERVVVNGLQRARPGIQVEPQEAPSPASSGQS